LQSNYFGFCKILRNTFYGFHKNPKSLKHVYSFCLFTLLYLY
jgi:hypothetical protein